MRTATGSDSPELSSTLRFLEQHGFDLHDEHEDLVLYRVYRDEMFSGEARTFADIVIPGIETRKAFPPTNTYGIHFRKIYTPASPPIGRGETPEVEFARTIRALSKIPTDLGNRLKPLAHESLVYRSRVVPGQTFAAMSPFSDLSYEDAIAAPLIPEVADRLEMRISASYDATLRLHKAGVLHGDLHLDNIMWIADDPTAPVQPIDLASTVFKEDISAQEWDMGVFDDLNEFLREAGLLQLNQKRRIIGCCFDEARKLASELFPEDIATALRAL
ncbi:phosphotransferase [Geminisphaera colitermitum]|uniref:phosphotransferase n=1 Tax=Geminisphaera colitermitum TaxID=1148786 RepID=UPI0018E33B86|nr:phosphotransferase [Geminisphaera colitermitum]